MKIKMRHSLTLERLVVIKKACMHQQGCRNRDPLQFIRNTD